MPTLPKLREQPTYRGQYLGLQFKISSWEIEVPVHGVERAWNYYVYIPEYLTKPEVFAELWLEDKLSRWTQSSPERVSHDYMAGKVGEIEMHGGITFYQKHGHSIGHRLVEIGCDYQHLMDQNQIYTKEDVLQDVIKTIEHIKELGYLK